MIYASLKERRLVNLFQREMNSLVKEEALEVDQEGEEIMTGDEQVFEN